MDDTYIANTVAFAKGSNWPNASSASLIREALKKDIVQEKLKKLVRGDLAEYLLSSSKSSEELDSDSHSFENPPESKFPSHVDVAAQSTPTKTEQQLEIYFIVNGVYMASI